MAQFNVLIDVGYTIRREVELPGRVSAKKIKASESLRDWLMNNKFAGDLCVPAIEQDLSNLEATVAQVEKLRGDARRSFFAVTFDVWGTREATVDADNEEDAKVKAREALSALLGTTRMNILEADVV